MRPLPNLVYINTHEIDIGFKPKNSHRKAKSERVGGGSRGFHGRRGFSGSVVPNFSSGSSQKCITRMSFRSQSGLHQKNLDYIQKEGKSIDGKKPVLYGSDSEEDYKEMMIDKNWRIIISPESNDIDLTVLTREFVKRLENYSGYKFTWVAANHYDTNNHHTHLLINGIDKTGKDVNFLPKGSYPKICSNIAKQLCTQMLGYKTKEQIQKEKAKSATASRVTGLDRKLERYISSNRMNKDYMNDRDAVLLNTRLEFLKSLELCSFDKKTHCFYFKEGWIEELKKLGKYNMYYDGFKYADCPRDKYTLHSISENGDIEGEVLHKYIRQKDSNNFALIIKKEDGSVGFVPLSFYPTNCRVGDNVKIVMKNQKTYINKVIRKK